MRFWDSSALVPFFIAERSTDEVRRALEEDRSLVVWWGTSVECTAAIARAEREGRLERRELEAATRDLARLRADWTEVDAVPAVRLVAERLTRTHPLRAGDALQLSAALAAAEGSPSALQFLTLDDRLAAAAMREGFPVVRFGAS
jgi:predicted nucleic acid-binding protein